MNIKYVILFGMILLALLIICGIICYRYDMHKKARELVKSRSDQQKLTDLNKALKPFGFAYDLSKDIFYSREDAWQRTVGYGKIYDVMAPVMNMIIDCEPIYFEYEDRCYMIEFWKGQYGITTGAELGIYVAEKQDTKPEHIFYQCAPQEDELLINMTLWKNGKKLFQRGKIHWWLTGFRLGEFSYPGELMLEASVSFTEPEMLEAFLQGCYQAGYQPKDLHVWCNRVALCIAVPKTPQPPIGKLRKWFVQWQNRHNCRLYARVTKCFERTIDKLDYLMQAYPGIFALVTGMGRIGFKSK